MRFKLFFFFLCLAPFIFLLFHSPGFFLTHDGPFHIERTFNFVDSLREGNFPPTWSRFYNSSFGSPIFLYLFPLPYWISSFFYLLGVNLIYSVRLAFILFQLLVLVATYLWLRKGLNLRIEAALAGAFLYLYSPYNVAQVLVRGSLRELAGSALFPLMLYALTQLAKTQNKKCLVLTVSAITLFLLADGLSVIIFLLLLAGYLGYLLWSCKNRLKFITLLSFASFLALLIASFIYLPFVFELSFLKWTTNNFFQDHFVYFTQLFDPHWGFGFSEPGPRDMLSFQIGIVNLVAILLATYLWIKRKLNRKLISIAISILLLFILLMLHLPMNLTIWETIPFLKLVLFPWRFLAPVVLICSLFGALATNYFKIGRKTLLLIFLAIITISSRYLRTNQIISYDQSYLLNNAGDATAFHEFIPVWRDKTSEFDGFSNKVDYVSGQGQISNLKVTNNLISFTGRFEAESKIRVNTLYFPGWGATVDKNTTPIEITSNVGKNPADKRDLSGLMQITVSPGTHNVQLKFSDTPVRRLGKILSLVGIGIFLIILVS